MVALMSIRRRSSPMFERLRAGHFATLFSEGVEPEETPPPASPELSSSPASAFARLLAASLRGVFAQDATVTPIPLNAKGAGEGCSHAPAR